MTSLSGQINSKPFVSTELNSPAEQSTDIAQLYTFLQGRGACCYPHEYYTCVSVCRSNRTLCQTYPSKLPKKSSLPSYSDKQKAEHKENERYTTRVINRKKKNKPPCTNYASREMEFRNNFILSVISAISQKPSSNKPRLSSFSCCTPVN